MDIIVYVVTYNDYYGRPLFDDCFLDKKGAENHIKDNDYLNRDPTTSILEFEF